MEWIAFKSVISPDEANRRQWAIHEQWDETSDTARVEQWHAQKPRRAALEAARLDLIDAMKRGLLIGEGQPTPETFDHQRSPNPPYLPILPSLFTENTTVTPDGTLGPDPSKPLAHLRWGERTWIPDPAKPGARVQHQNIRYRNIRFQAADILRLWPQRAERRRRGRPDGYNWEPVMIRLGAKLAADGAPRSGDGIQAQLEAWVATQFPEDDCPAESVIRKKVGAAIKAHRQALE